MKRRFSAKYLVLCALFTALISVGAFIRIPFTALPNTMQFVFVLLAGLILGGKRGAFSCLVYALIGLFGAPIFAKGGGFWYVFEPSFGYVIGFILCNLIMGAVLGKGEKSFKRRLFASFVGMLVVYAVGMTYYYLICDFVLNTPVDFKFLIVYCFASTAIGDVIACFFAAFLADKVGKILR